MYESLTELANQDKIKFTSSYDNKGYLSIFDISEEELNAQKEKIKKELKSLKLSEQEFEQKFNDRLNEIQVKQKVIKLDWQDELALSNIDALKEEFNIDSV